MDLQPPVAQQPRTEQVTVTPSQPRGRTPRERYRLTIYKLGVTEVVLGVSCALIWAVSIIMAVVAQQRSCPGYGRRSTLYRSSCYQYRFYVTYISSGIWCGVFLIISGSLGVCMRRKPSACMYTANMTMSIISSVMMGLMIIFSSIAAASYEAYRYSAIKIPHIALVVIGLTAMVICIVHSAYCCAGTCCGQKGNYGTVMYTAPPQQYVQLPNGQFMLVQAQPMLQQSYPVMINPHAAVQHTQVFGASTSGLSQPTGVYPAAGVPYASIPSQPGGAHGSVPQPGTATKQEEALSHVFPTHPPSYDESNPWILGRRGTTITICFHTLIFHIHYLIALCCCDWRPKFLSWLVFHVSGFEIKFFPESNFWIQIQRAVLAGLLGRVLGALKTSWVLHGLREIEQSVLEKVQSTWILLLGKVSNLQIRSTTYITGTQNVIFHLYCFGSLWCQCQNLIDDMARL